MKKLLLCALLITLFKAAAQDTGSIAGKLIDKEVNDEPLAFANVLIKGTTKGSICKKRFRGSIIVTAKKCHCYARGY